MQLQKSAGSILASNKLARSAPKRVAVRVNGGLGGAAGGERSSHTTSIETNAGVSDYAEWTVEDRARPRAAWERRPAVVVAHESGGGRRGTGAERPLDSTKGPCRWKAPQDVTSHRLSRVGGQGDLGGFLTAEWRRDQLGRARVPKGGRTKVTVSFHGRGRGDRGVRGLVGSRRRGKKTPTLMFSTHRQRWVRARGKTGSACLAPIRWSVHECRETLGPSVNPTKPKTSRESTRWKPWSEPGTHEVRVHVDQSGGRSRSDASRALTTDRPQGRLVESSGR